MKSNKIFGVIWTGIAIVLTFLLFSSLKGRINIFGGFSIMNSSKLYQTLNFSPSEIKDIDVDLASDSLQIEKTSGSSIIVELYGNEKSVPKASIYKDTLKIESQKAVFHMFGTSGKALIKLPESFIVNDGDFKANSGSIHISDTIFNKLDCNSTSGSINLENVTADKTDCKASSGSIRINNSKAKEFDVKASSGSVRLENCEAESFDCNISSGSTYLSGSFGKIEVNSRSGSINADLTKELTSDSEFHAVSGGIHLNVPSTSNFRTKYSCTSGTYKNNISGTNGKKGTDIVGNGGPLIELSTTSGSIHIN